jgi:uncharacterized protein
VSRGFLTPAKQGTLINLRVSPGAKRTAIDGPYGENAIKLKVAAPPVDGKANAEVERFLAELLDVPRSDVSIIRGATSRDKQALVRNLAHAQTREALSTHLP